jgi:hypothetical protein
MKSEKRNTGEYTVFSDDDSFIADIRKSPFGNYWVAFEYDENFEENPFKTADTKKELLEKLKKEEADLLEKNAEFRSKK